VLFVYSVRVSFVYFLYKGCTPLRLIYIIFTLLIYIKKKITSELYLGRKGEVSLGRVCGVPSLPQGLRSLYGRQRSGKFSLWII
jgi:hypothetical protein